MKNAVMIVLLSYSIDSQLPQDLSKAVSGKAYINKQLVEYNNNHQLCYGLTESKSFVEQEVVADKHFHQNDQSLNAISIPSNNENDEDIVKDQIVQKKKFFRQKQSDRYKLKNLQRKYTKPCIPSHR